MCLHDFCKPLKNAPSTGGFGYICATATTGEKQIDKPKTGK
jgi:hypothetical protein